MRHRPAGSPRHRARPGWGTPVLCSKSFGSHGDSYECDAAFIQRDEVCADLPNDLEVCA
jgi:hypothetical protein